MGRGAAIASFFVSGLGQAFKGEVVRGFKIFSGSMILAAIQIIGALIHPVFGLLMYPVIALYWFAQIVDAYGTWRLPI